VCLYTQETGNLVHGQRALFTYRVKGLFRERIGLRADSSPRNRQRRLQESAIRWVAPHCENPFDVRVENGQHAGVLDRRRDVLREEEKISAKASRHADDIVHAVP